MVDILTIDTPASATAAIWPTTAPPRWWSTRSATSTG